MEVLEDRRVLASLTLGAVNGSVFVDNNNSGGVDAGEGIVAATIQLWQDADNNNSFNSTIDSLIDTTATNAAGQYEFRNLPSGNYFTVQTSQTVGGVALDALTSPVRVVDGTGVATQSVDDFFGDSGPTIDESPAGSPETQNFSAATAVGGNREFTAEFLSGLDGEEVSVRTENSMLRVNPDVQSVGRYKVTWDGGGAAGLSPTGLGGVNWLANDGAGVCLNDVFVDQPGGSVTVRVYSDATNFSEASISSLTPLVPQDFFFSFSDASGDADFAPVGGSGADFSNVGAVELEFNASQIAMDGSLSNLGVYGLNSQQHDFRNQPTAPQIDVEKLTNGNQADRATDTDVPIVSPGSTVAWTYQVTNTGTIDITTVTLVDDQVGTITNIVNDGNGDAILQPNEVWTYQATGTAISGLYANTAEVIGQSAAGQTGRDSDDSHYRGAAASIDIEKFTNGNQADLATDADVPSISVGDSVTWTYRVTNTGDLDITNLVVTDDVQGSVTTITDNGDGDAVLEPSEVWEYTLTTSARAGAYENSGCVTGQASAIQQTVTDCDQSHYFGVAAAIEIEKATNGQDADVGPGPLVFLGQTASFTYLVTNNGNAPISEVVVVDDDGTPNDTADDFTPTFVDGDTNNDGLLDPNEAWRYQATRTATVAGPYTNVAVVRGRDPLRNLVQDDDPSNHNRVELRAASSKRGFLASNFR